MWNWHDDGIYKAQAVMEILEIVEMVIVEMEIVEMDGSQTCSRMPNWGVRFTSLKKS